MAADFDGSGFAAVDEFFGTDDAVTAGETASKIENTRTENNTRHRLGVGASHSRTGAEQNNETLNDTTTSKRILQVGGSKQKRRHRKRGFGGDDSDEDDGTDKEEHDEDEEEEGRTAIDVLSSSEPTTKLVSASVVVKEAAIEKLQKKKKKLGKKERQQKQQEQSNSDEADETTTSVVEPKEAAASTTAEQEEKTKKKRKRRKIRSRQKNIYKDKRDVKPAHLIPGRGSYQGRPLTAETRAKLNLPKYEKSPFRAEWNDDDDDNGNVLDAMPLAVESIVDEKTATKEEESGILISETADRKKKRQKTKYKNL